MRNFGNFRLLISLKCPRIGIDRNVNVEAIVTKLNNGIGCNIGNQFFC